MADSLAEGPHAAADAAEKNSKSGSGVSVTRIGVFLGILLAIIQPLITLTAIAGIIAFEKRKVRISRWLIAAGTISILGILLSGVNLSTWGSWLFARPSMPIIGDAVAEWVADYWPALQDIRTHGIINAATIGVPIGLLITALWAWWRHYEIDQRGTMEGPEYSAHRPIGALDRLRTKRNTEQLRNGTWSRRHPGDIAVGIGKYGAIGHIPNIDFRATTIIIGTTQSGKTRAANSLADQLVHETHGGNITLDFKVDADMVARKAELARQMGVPFKHFVLSSKHGAHYRQPHPYAPPQPAHYDPFSKGNGTSKSAMLLNSVPRDGDAAVYFRQANEGVKLAWDIAALNGLNNRTHADGSAFSGLEVLTAMLDVDTLFAEGKKVTASAVKHSNNSLTDSEAQRRAAAITNRIDMLEKETKAKGMSTFAAALSSVRSDVYGYINDSAAGNWLNIADVPVLQIDLIQAILGNQIILFSLPAQDYPEMSAMIGTMVLLDLGNAVTTMRHATSLITDTPTKWTSKGTDKVPWNPLVLQIEELGSIRSSAAAAALLGLLNKSADVEIRAIISSQSIADLDAVDGIGGWRRQIVAQAGNVMTLTVPEATDGQMICEHSGVVPKKKPTENRKAANNRFGFNLGASDVASVRSQVVDETRIPFGIPKSLTLGSMEMLWINTRSSTPAVHTLDHEGPNQWYEVVTSVPIHEPPKGWNPFDTTSDEITAIEEQRNQVIMDLRDRLAHDPVLHALTTNAAIADPAEMAQHPIAPQLSDSGAPDAGPLSEQWAQLVTPQPDPTRSALGHGVAEPEGHSDTFDSEGIPLPEAPMDEEPPFDFPQQPVGSGQATTGDYTARPDSSPFDDHFSSDLEHVQHDSNTEAPPAGDDPFDWESAETASSTPTDSASDGSGATNDDPFDIFPAPSTETPRQPQRNQNQPAPADPFSEDDGW